MNRLAISTGLIAAGGVDPPAVVADTPADVRGRRWVRGHGRVAGLLGEPVTVGGVTIVTGDLIVGDADGVVAIPQADIERILDAADARVAQERDFFTRLRAGASTVELYSLPGG